jgi:hypothetical protein
MTTPPEPRHSAAAPPQGPSTQEIPAVPAEQPTGGPVTGATRAGALPAPGQQPPQPVVPQPVVPQPVPPPVAPPAATHAATPPAPAWPDTLTDEPSPPTRPATVYEGVQPTGPVDFVPGLPGAGTPPPPAPARKKRATAALDRTALAAVGLAALAVVLLQLGLVDDDADLWRDVTLWSVFATAATVLGLLALAVRAATGRPSARVTTRIVVGAVLALAVFWLLVVLPIVASDPGFLVTAALLALGGALWLGPAKDR